MPGLILRTSFVSDITLMPYIDFWILVIVSTLYDVTSCHKKASTLDSHPSIKWRSLTAVMMWDVFLVPLQNPCISRISDGRVPPTCWVGPSSIHRQTHKKITPQKQLGQSAGKGPVLYCKAWSVLSSWTPWPFAAPSTPLRVLPGSWTSGSDVRWEMHPAKR